MYICLSSDKYRSWHAERGVVIELSGDTKVSTDPPQHSPIDITISGMHEPKVTIDLHPPIPEDIQEAYEWVVDNGYLNEWYEETARYQAAISRIQLPCKPAYDTCGGYSDEDGEALELSLLYRLSMGAAPYSIDITVEVHSEAAEVSVVVRKKLKYGSDTLHVETISTTDTVTIDSLRAMVRGALDNLTRNLDQVAGLPMIPQAGTELPHRSNSNEHGASK